MTAGAVGALACVVLLAPADRIIDVEPERPEALRPHTRANSVPRVSQSVAVEAEDTRAVRAAGQNLESRGREPEFDEAHIGDYIDPDALPPSTMPAGFAVNVGGAYQNPEHDFVSPGPHEAISEVGEYIHPEDAL